MKVVVKQKQSIFDIALQYTGNSEHAMLILHHNHKTSSDLVVGEVIDIPDSIVSKKHLNFFATMNIDVGCAAEPLDDSSYTQPEEGEVEVSVNGQLFKTVTAPAALDIQVVNTLGAKVPVSFIGNDVIVNDTVIYALYQESYQGAVKVPVDENASLNFHEMTNDITITSGQYPTYIDGNVQVRINGKYYKTVTAPASLNVPLKNTQGDAVSLGMASNKIILSDVDVEIEIDGVLQQTITIPIHHPKTININ